MLARDGRPVDARVAGTAGQGLRLQLECGEWLWRMVVMQFKFLSVVGRALCVCAVVFSLTACSKKKEHQAAIESLNQEIADRDVGIQDLETRRQELEQKNSELEIKASEAEQKAGQLEEQLRQAQSALDTLQQAKEAETTKAKTPSQVIEESKAQLGKQAPAVLKIEGDASRGHGSIIQVDGKTWLYSVAQVFSGNAKLSIKDPEGKVLTQFGEFQVAADTSLVRLEIPQAMPVKLEIDPKATVATNTPLMAMSADSRNAGLQMLSCRVAKINDLDFEIDSNALSQNFGCPLFAADSGKVIAIFSPSMGEASRTLWPDDTSNRSDEARTRAVRLNRPIAWKPMNMTGFLEERRKIDDLNKITRMLHALASVKVSDEAIEFGGPIEGSRLAMAQVIQQNAAPGVAAALKKVQSDLANKKVRVAQRDILRGLVKILGETKSNGSRQATELKSIGLSAYHRALAGSALKWHAQADQAIDATLLNLQR